MSIGFFIAGLCFLCLPGFQMYDFLPDFIGALLLLHAIDKGTLLSLGMKEASKHLTRLCYFSLFRAVSAFFLVVLFPSIGNQQGEGLQTLLTIVFCGFELFFSLYAFHYLFEGLSYLQTRHGSSLSLRPLTDLRTATYAFLIAKHVLNVLPTLDGLFGSQYSSSVDRGFRGIEYYTNLLQLFNLFLVTLFGIIWMILFVRYLLKLRKEEAFFATIEEKWQEEVALRPQFLLRRHIRTITFLIGAACFFAIDIAIDRVFLLPDPFAAALLIAVTILLFRSAFVKKSAIWISIVAFVLSVGAELFLDIFSKDYAEDAVYRGLQYHPTILSHYILSAVLQILWQIAFLVLLWIILQGFCRIIEQHTGHEGPSLNEKERSENEDLHHLLQKKCRWVFVFGCIYALSSVIYAFCLPWALLYWVVQLAAGIAFAGKTIATVTAIYDQIEYKYL